MDFKSNNFIQKLDFASNWNKILIGFVIFSLLAGIGTGYILASGNRGLSSGIPLIETPKSPEQDTKTFKDFAEGTLKKRPELKNPEDYVEGTHLLIREGAVPVALTSSVVDLSKYEGKKIKVFGETQKAIKEGWLMDVGKVEER